MSHLDDPDRLKSLLAETLTTEQYSCWKIEPKSLVSFSNDPKVQNFTNTFLRSQTSDDSISASTEELEIQQIITLQFYNCLTKDRMHALPIYMNLLMVRSHSTSVRSVILLFVNNCRHFENFDRHQTHLTSGSSN